MKEFKGTKGKWQVKGDKYLLIDSLYKADDMCIPALTTIAMINTHTGFETACKANAQLIACAPETIKALIELAKAIREKGFAGHFSPELHYADTIINKALGKEE